MENREAIADRTTAQPIRGGYERVYFMPILDPSGLLADIVRAERDLMREINADLMASHRSTVAHSE
jgi:hypothetical protein